MKVFISHSYQDREFVERLSHDISEKDIQIFDAIRDIEVGQSITEKITHEIKASDAVIFVVSKSSAKSEWSNAELSLAISGRAAGEERALIPIIIDKEAKAPFFLRDLLHLDMSDNAKYKENVNRLIKTLKEQKPQPHYKQQLSIEKETIRARKELLEFEKLQFEEIHRDRLRQLFLLTLSFTLIATAATATVLLAKFAEIPWGEFKWLWSFILGAIASLLGSFFYMKRERHRKNELLQKLKELELIVKERGMKE